MPSPPPHHRVIGAAAHLAVWAGAYVSAVAALAVLMLNGPIPASGRDALSLACAFLTGVSVYLQDRVKVADRWLDPADELGHPARWAFLHPRRRVVRTIGFVLSLVSMATAFVLAPWLVGVVVGAHVGVWIYAGLPPAPARRRLKDVFIIKNLAVAVSITAFGIALAAAARGVPSPGRAVAAASVLMLIVFGDAALCDLDDTDADRRFGTKTIPVRVSARATWITASAAHTLAAAVMLLDGFDAPGLVLSIGLMSTTALLAAWRPPRLRDIVDLRLPMLAAAAIVAA